MSYGLDQPDATSVQNSRRTDHYTVLGNKVVREDREVYEINPNHPQAPALAVLVAVALNQHMEENPHEHA